MIWTTLIPLAIQALSAIQPLSSGVDQNKISSAGEGLFQCLRDYLLVWRPPITVYRDAREDYRREGKTYPGLFGIHQHWGYDYLVNDIENASAGCLVGRKTQGHLEFIDIVKTDSRYSANHGYKFLTAIMPGAEALGKT